MSTAKKLGLCVALAVLGTTLAATSFADTPVVQQQTTTLVFGYGGLLWTYTPQKR